MRRMIAFAFAVLAAASAVAQTPSPQPGGYGPPITVGDAQALIKRGMEQSAAKGLRMTFAVGEPSGGLVASAKMDGALYASVQLAQQKARTSARLRMTTAFLEERVQAGRTSLLSSDELIAIAGGVPIVVNGRVVGAFGVSGGATPEDGAIAAATVAGAGETLNPSAMLASAGVKRETRFRSHLTDSL